MELQRDFIQTAEAAGLALAFLASGTARAEETGYLPPLESAVERERRSAPTKAKKNPVTPEEILSTCEGLSEKIREDIRTLLSQIGFGIDDLIGVEIEETLYLDDILSCSKDKTARTPDKLVRCIAGTEKGTRRTSELEEEAPLPPSGSTSPHVKAENCLKHLQDSIAGRKVLRQILAQFEAKIKAKNREQMRKLQALRNQVIRHR